MAQAMTAATHTPRTTGNDGDDGDARFARLCAHIAAQLPGATCFQFRVRSVAASMTVKAWKSDGAVHQLVNL